MKEQKDPSDNELLQAMLAGDEAELATLYRRRQGSVYRFALQMSGSSSLAEDVTQEVFIRLYKHMDSLPDLEMLRPWLIRVAINLARNTVRGNIRANTRDENYVKESVESSVFSVESEYEQQSGVSEINRALNKVKEPHRSCLVLKQQGLSYREIAESLSLNETSIGTYVARARAEFMRHYGKIGG